MNTAGELFSHWPGWRIGFDLFFVAFFGGIYAVPLNAIMQHALQPDSGARGSLPPTM